MTATAALVVVGGLVAVPATASAAPAKPSPARQPAGKNAFTPDSFTTNPAPSVKKKAIADARKALGAHRSAGHVKSGDAFTPRTVVVAKNGASDVRFDRTYKGMPVYGGDLIVHLKPGGSYRALNTASLDASVSTTAKVASAKAAGTSKAQLKGKVSKVGTPHLAVWSHGRSSQLVWETVVRGTKADSTPSVLHVLVDANKGRVVTQRDEIDTIAAPGQVRKSDPAPLVAGTGNSIYSGTVPIDLTQSGSTYQMKDPSHGNGYTTNLNHSTSGTGTIFSNSTGTFGNGTNSDPASAGVDAHYGAAETFDYYKNTHGRNGIFGNGQGVPSRTHYGNQYVNAFWDGTQMTYGDGSGNNRPLVELDVAGHEMSHGVSGALVGWEENGETGGMNEGTSDIFGTMVEFYANNAKDTPDYTMGELININGDNQPLRWMYNPSLDGNSPNCYSSSNGGLDPHYSLGPLTHWFFLLAVGSGDHGYGNSPTCNSSTVTGIGNDKSAKIWYRALASYANSNENYANARTDSLKAAADLYGTHCTEYNTVNAAWAAVSVTGSDPVPGTCPGQGNPTVTNPGNQTSTVGQAASLQIHATDPGGLALTYSATGLPAGLSINSSSGLISGTPTAAGTSSVTVTATDTANKSGTASFSWTVNPAGQGNPTVTNPGNQSSTVGNAVSLQIRASDPGGLTLTYSATGLPAGLSINSSSGLISGTPTAQGTSSVTVTAKNTNNLTGTATFNWTVSPPSGNCTSPGNKASNGGFESGTAPWTTTAGVVSANGSGQSAHAGTHFAWLDGYGTTHTDSASQSVTIPAGCHATLTYWVHVDTDEAPGTVYDTATVKIGGTTVGTFNNTTTNNGYVQKSVDVSQFAGQTVTLSFSGTEDPYLQTSFVFDDIAVTAS